MLHTLTYQLYEVVPYINWLYFFHAWELPSKYGSIAHIHDCEGCRQTWLHSFPKEEQERAHEAAKLYQDAKKLLQELNGRFQTHARINLLPAYSQGEDIVVCKDDGTEQHLPMLRQQSPDKDGICWCLSDFIQPLPTSNHLKEGNAQFSSNTPTTSPYSWVGLFVSTVDKELEQRCKDDTYLSLLHQTLADRLAEATVEKAHQEIRTQFWGYTKNEKLSIDDLFCERYQGRRPAIGYPSLPDQSLNFELAKLLHFDEMGIELTENGAMLPHASTSGLMIAHPRAHHFSIGKINEEQLADYAHRRCMPIERMRAFLSTNIQV